MSDYLDASRALKEASNNAVQISSGMNSIFGLSDKTLGYITIAASAGQIVGGFASGYKALIAIREVLNSKATIEASALTTAQVALGPVGWTKIAIATGAFVTAAAVTDVIMNYTLQTSTNDAAGRGILYSVAGGL